MLNKIFLISLFVSCLLPTFAQRPVNTDFTIEPPLRIPLLMSGGFGELRNNHFHSGLDFKTQGVIGKPVYSADDGYVSRIGVSPYGYGLAVYIDHPTGVTTVYGHLDRFAPFIDRIVKSKQYEQESFSVTLYFKKNEIPVKRGQQIAYAGNSGGSGGPHLHFEMRETISEYLIDPLIFFKGLVKDNRKPEVLSIALFPLKGVVNGAVSKTEVALKGKSQSPSFTAWGEVVAGLKSYDYMDGTTNIYGVKTIKLFVDGKLLYTSVLDRYSYDNSRAVNSFISYEDWVLHRSFIMRSYVDPGNRLGIYRNVIDRGVLKIDEEREYKCVYQLSDAFGNITEQDFKIYGVKQRLEKASRPEGSVLLKCGKANVINKGDLLFELPAEAFYEDTYFTFDRTKSTRYNSDIFHLHDELTPIHAYSSLSIRPLPDTLSDKRQYYIVRIKGKSEIPVAVKYTGGFVRGRVRDLGRYAVKVDQTKPVITPLSPAVWGKNGVVKFRVRDGQSGVSTFRGEIDGHFALFEMDGKTSTLIYRADGSRIGRKKNHRLKLAVTDMCGNEAIYTGSFYW